VLVCGALLGAAAIPYLRGLSIGYLSDDFSIASAVGEAGSAAEVVTSPVFRVFYRPVPLLAWWWMHGLLGEQTPLGLAILSLAIHAGNSMLVYAVGRRVIGDSYGALLGAMLFAVHPLHIEAVVWKCCLADLLCTGFCLVSLLCLELYLGASGPRRRYLGLTGALCAFFLALLSKEAALALPGFALLRVALGPAQGRVRRLVTVGCAYSLPLGAALLLRLWSIGRIGGYSWQLHSFWDRAPSGPLVQIGSFLLPVHTALFAKAMAVWLHVAVVVLMAGVVVWLSRGLVYVSGRRLLLWLGYVFLMAAPVSPYPTVGPWLEQSRFAYLPTIGLAWLFGGVCAGRGRGWRRSGAAAAAVLAGAAMLTVWYTDPWREADRLADTMLAAGVEVAEELPQHSGGTMLYVRDFPHFYLNAFVFNVGYGEALSDRLDRPASVYTVWYIGGGLGSGRLVRMDPKVLDVSVLLPGEYVVAWRPESERMEVVRAGAPPSEGAGSGGLP
jgi:hypothetical protein